MGGNRRGRGLLAAALAGTAAMAAQADHLPLGPVDPTDQEQLGIYTLNRARNDPAAYGTSIGFDLSAVPAQPPLAVNRNLTGSSRFHAEEMLDHHYYAHVSAISGLGANQMAVQNGYDAFGSGLGANWGPTNTIESIARGVNTLPSVLNTLSALIIDKDVVGAGHRAHLLALNSQFQAHREIGVGIAVGADAFPEYGFPKTLPTRVYAIHTANRGPGTQFLTGVVFRDLNGNLRYDAGEGIGNASITEGANEVRSLPSGGWSMPVTPGAKVVVCTGDGWVARAPVSVGAGNLEIDFHAGLDGGEVSFGFRNGIPASSNVYANFILSTGTAPFGVSYAAVGDFDRVDWDLPGGGTVSGPTLDATVDQPGLFPFLMVANSTNTWSTDAVVAVADAPDGAGAGTTLPASRALVAPKGLFKRIFNMVGKDQAKLAAGLELPGGFSPEGKEVQVCIGAVKGTFTLDAKGKAKDLESGSTLVLKAKWPAGGVGVAAGTLAKMTVLLKGDLARGLDATGMENRTVVGATRTIPLALWIDGVGYSAFGQASFTATFGKSGKATVVALPPE